LGYNFGVGREAPTFVLSAHDGSEINLKQYRGEWFAILVFFSRTSPKAIDQLSALSGQGDTLWGLRGQLLGVAAGDIDDVRTDVEAARGLSFPVVADDGSVAAAYGAAQAVAGDGPPLVFIVDRAGKIVWMGEGDDDLKPASVLDALRTVAR
jgi:peroxiredoxin